jgi:hypothetical protein
MSDADNFLNALRSIDGTRETPQHCRGWLRDMQKRGLISKDAAGVTHLTAEGRLRAFPQYGALRITRERVNDAIYNEGRGLSTSANVYKTFAARDSRRSLWYTPEYAKTIARPK